ncbi:hypothetical protein EW093_12675 [Thiospirochaeta perfilievii]|uniref:Lactonase family protein n=1 Tax=Thiospirochaeta perfilievii TaxID=252967 RepID=A0A5C1QBT8_9SPIO|nr:beta-propeller fold lactonase family protein [Thiospirochaeta perfilievii]QEN05533.1 hypothetical protein EW093_12675 [Thiospirochaeta perfilievii]
MDFFIVGTYTEKLPHAPNACGDGVVIISFDKNKGVLEINSKLDIKNPSYLYWDREYKQIVSIAENEGDLAGLHTISLVDNHNMKLENSLLNSGRSLCHITKNSVTETYYTASYGDGKIYSYTRENGTLIKKSEHSYTGFGPNKDRQESPHAHQVTVDYKHKQLYVCDLGSDSIWIHRNGDFNNPKQFRLPNGYGPRHLIVGPNQDNLYILNELKPILCLIKIESDGSLKYQSEIPLVEDFDSLQAPAAIKLHPSGKTIACSNRFEDKISIFNIEKEFKLESRFSSGGKTPRDIEFSKDGDWLLIANQDSSLITIKSFNCKTGIPKEEWGLPLNIGTPVCITKEL